MPDDSKSEGTHKLYKSFFSLFSFYFLIIHTIHIFHSIFEVFLVFEKHNTVQSSRLRPKIPAPDLLAAAPGFQLRLSSLIFNFLAAGAEKYKMFFVLSG